MKGDIVPISLTREEFLKRLNDRIDQISFPNVDELKSRGIDKRIFRSEKLGVHINLSELMGAYLANLLDVVYREP